MRLPTQARHAGLAALTAAAAALALAAAAGPLFYPQPRSNRWTLETTLRFWAPLLAPMAGASLAGVVLRASGRGVIVAGALGTLGLFAGLRTRPWTLWAHTSAMARANASWVTAAVFLGALLGTVAEAWRGRGVSSMAEAQPAEARLPAAAHLAAFVAMLLAKVALGNRTSALEAGLLGLAGLGAGLSVAGPSRRAGVELMRLSGTVLLGWLAGFVSWEE